MTAKIIQHDALTSNTIEREPTSKETLYFAKLAEQEIAEKQAEIDAQTAKAAARQAVLNKLGLTADEAAALLG